MRRSLTILLMSITSLLATTGPAQALVVKLGASGQAGVAVLPGSSTAGLPTVTSGGACSDPWLAPDLSLPANGLCSHGGSVIHSNETFALTWDPLRRYWQTTRQFVEQFLGDVASGSGTLSSPYSVTGQYQDTTGRAANASLYGGGCVDFGAVGGSACKLGSADGTGPGHDYAASGCPVTGTNVFATTAGAGSSANSNDVCVTDAQLQGEVATMIGQAGLVAHTKAGYTPLVVLLTPPGVETCLDSSGTLCSANGASAAQFCSYHSQLTLPNGTQVAYVVQPWTALTGCDEPKLPPLPANPTAVQLATAMGVRIVNPLSQGHIAALVNPFLNGWYATSGAEITDNGGCQPLGPQLDTVTVGKNGYVLQREFSNAGVIESDPNAPACAPLVDLTPAFVIPSAVNPGDVVEFDGSTTRSSLIVPNANYLWDFGDGTNAVGPSVVHSYVKGGAYTVKLTVTDRGGNVAALSQTVTVLGATGQTGTGSTGTTPQAKSRLHAYLQLLPQGLRAMLRRGLAARVTSNEQANGIVTLSISRGAARRAHIKAGRGSSVVIGRGTVSGIKAGSMNLHLRLTGEMATKLSRLAHVAMTVRLALVASGGDHLAIIAAGRY